MEELHQLKIERLEQKLLEMNYDREQIKIRNDKLIKQLQTFTDKSSLEDSPKTPTPILKVR